MVSGLSAAMIRAWCFVVLLIPGLAAGQSFDALVARIEREASYKEESTERQIVAALTESAKLRSASGLAAIDRLGKLAQEQGFPTLAVEAARRGKALARRSGVEASSAVRRGASLNLVLSLCHLVQEENISEFHSKTARELREELAEFAPRGSSAFGGLSDNESSNDISETVVDALISTEAHELADKIARINLEYYRVHRKDRAEIARALRGVANANIYKQPAAAIRFATDSLQEAQRLVESADRVREYTAGMFTLADVERVSNRPSAAGVRLDQLQQFLESHVGDKPAKPEIIGAAQKLTRKRTQRGEINEAITAVSLQIGTLKETEALLNRDAARAYEIRALLKVRLTLFSDAKRDISRAVELAPTRLEGRRLAQVQKYVIAYADKDHTGLLEAVEQILWSGTAPSARRVAALIPKLEEEHELGEVQPGEGLQRSRHLAALAGNNSSLGLRALYLSAVFHAELGQAGPALDLLEKIAERQKAANLESVARSKLTRTAIYAQLRAGNIESALGLLSKAEELVKSDLSILSTLTQTYLESGEIGEAQASIAQLLSAVSATDLKTRQLALGVAVSLKAEAALKSGEIETGGASALLAYQLLVGGMKIPAGLGPRTFAIEVRKFADDTRNRLYVQSLKRALRSAISSAIMGCGSRSDGIDFILRLAYIIQIEWELSSYSDKAPLDPRAIDQLGLSFDEISIAAASLAMDQVRRGIPLDDMTALLNVASAFRTRIFDLLRSPSGARDSPIQTLTRFNARATSLPWLIEASLRTDREDVARLHSAEETLALAVKRPDPMQPILIRSFEQIRSEQERLDGAGGRLELYPYRLIPTKCEKPGADEGFRYGAHLRVNGPAKEYRDVGAAAHVETLLTSLLAGIRQKNSAEYRRNARSLYSAIFGSVSLSQVPGHRVRVTIDELTARVPWPVLIDDQGNQLVDLVNVSYVAQSYADREPYSSALPETAALILAAPDYGSPGPGVDSDQPIFSTLAAAHLEGKAVQKLLSLPNKRLLSGVGATEVELRNVRGPLILHLATHAYNANAALAVQDRNSRLLGAAIAISQARIALANANEHSPETLNDGTLNGFDVAALDLAGTQLVVLSACETGTGQARESVGPLGLQMAFLAAGANSVIASWWKVDDLATKILLLDFYNGVIGGLSREVALTKAQIKLRSDPQFREPWYWGGFSLTGDTEPLSLTH